MAAQNPHSTAAFFGLPASSHLHEDAIDDAARLIAYDTYTDLYHNQPVVFENAMRTQAADVIFRRLIAQSRAIVEGTNRYVGQGLEWMATSAEPASSTDPAGGENAAGVADEAIGATMAVLETLFRRERFVPKFLSLKRWMLTRGDGLLHITADPLKPEGQRLRIVELDPATYFAVADPADSERVIGCYLVNIVANDEGDEIAARLEYRRIMDEEQAGIYGTPIGGVYMRLSFYEREKWDDRWTGGEADLAPVPPPARFGAPRFETLLAGGPMPAQIAALPVYHFRNRPRGGSTWGTSELQGMETVLAGISQAATDQDLAVALNGLGFYWTNSGRPRNRAGELVEWEIAPGSMLEIEPEKEIGRVGGLGTISPSLDHIKFLKGEIQETTGTPALAMGNREPTAMSGVALAIEMAPVVAKAMEFEEEVKGVLDQMLYDLLNGWLPAYEGFTPNGVTVEAVFSSAIPKNPKEIVEYVTGLVAAKVVSAEWGREFLARELGWQFSPNEGAAVAAEAAAALDAEGARLDAAAGEVGL